MPSPLKSPIATERGRVPTATSVRLANAGGLQVAGVVTVSKKVFVVVEPATLNPVTVTRYVPGGVLVGCASVIRTTPVVGLAENVPLKSVVVETVIIASALGAASG